MTSQTLIANSPITFGIDPDTQLPCLEMDVGFHHAGVLAYTIASESFFHLK